MGALIQLAAVGKQDIFLTGKPDNSFFNVKYKRCANFAMEARQGFFNGTPNFGETITCILPRSGDLINKMYLRFELPDLVQTTSGNTVVSWVNSVGTTIIDFIELYIGGNLVDRHSGEWLDIWYQLSLSDAKKIYGYNSMVGYNEAFDTSSLSPYTGNASGNTGYRTIFNVPLAFWFNQNITQSLPLIALQYHEVTIRIKLRPLAECIKSANTTVPPGTNITQAFEVDSTGSDTSIVARMKNVYLYNTYIYLDTKEREFFAKNSHRYLISQLQKLPKDLPVVLGENTTDFIFNHPVKELIWIFNNSTNTTINSVTGNNWEKYRESMSEGNLLINGTNRIDTQVGEYFIQVQPWEVHTRVPNKYIYVYSFALHPESYNPSGTLNMSRVDNSSLLYESREASLITVYATNFNVLNINNGMAGLMFSN